MELEWDADKAARNLKKHGISFEDATLVFYDAGRIETYNGHEDYGEDQWATIGLAFSVCCMWSTPFDRRTPSALSPRGKPMPMKESNTVKRTLDLKKPLSLSAEQKARLDAVAAMPDEQIDYSDAPNRPDAVWVKAAAELPHTKQQITLRLDAEVLEFFKHTGKRSPVSHQCRVARLRGSAQSAREVMSRSWVMGFRSLRVGSVPGGYREIGVRSQPKISRSTLGCCSATLSKD